MNGKWKYGKRRMGVHKSLTIIDYKNLITKYKNHQHFLF